MQWMQFSTMVIGFQFYVNIVMVSYHGGWVSAMQWMQFSTMVIGFQFYVNIVIVSYHGGWVSAT